MKYIYLLSVLLLLLCVGCTRRENTLPEGNGNVNEEVSIERISVIMDKVRVPEEYSKEEEPIVKLEEGMSLYVNSPEGLRMRDKPDITGKRVFLLEDGQEVKIATVDPNSVVIDGIEGQWVGVETYKLKEWFLDRPTANPFEEAMVESNDIRGWVFSGYLSEEKREYDEKTLTVKEELEQFAVRYGGGVRGYNGCPDSFSLVVDKEDMFSHLVELSNDCFSKIKSLSRYGLSNVRYPVIPLLDKRLVLDYISYRGAMVKNIDALAQTSVRWLVLEINPLTSIAAIGNNPYIEDLSLSGCTQLKSLPDMSGMKNLSKLDINTTGVTTLDNIETIPHLFDVYLFNCTELMDIDALRRSKVRKLFIGRKGYSVMGGVSDKEGEYDRFTDWFEKYLPELEQNEGFQLLHAYDDLEF